MQSEEAASQPTQRANETLSVSSWRAEDWCAIWLGAAVLLAALAATWLSRPADVAERAARYGELTEQLDRAKAAGEAESATADAITAERQKLKAGLAKNPLASYLGTVGSWKSNPAEAFRNKDASRWPGVLGALACTLVLFTAGLAILGQPLRGFPAAFIGLFALALLAYVLAGQEVVKHYNLEYALWALVAGLVISNTIGTPAFVRPALRTELYIKTGLVLMGGEVLFNQLLALGPPGVFVAWVVTPTVLTLTYLFGQYVLRIPSKSLNMVISADMSVCGVSAAIATAAACKAKKEELSLAIGMSLAFTVIMMVVMPPAIHAMELGEVVGGAWIGGTIDSTGAVAAAGGMLGETALAVAATVKMIQNILIGVIAFAVATYWVTCVERSPDGARPSLLEIWRRFPKFVLGFVAASIVFSLIASRGVEGEAIAAAATETSKTLRGWCFCLAFVSIGLETNFRELSRFMVGGKPLILYLCGQALNLALTLAMAWLMFTKVFPDAAAALTK
jgi:uncharacterized membrane protein YadS